MHFSRLPATDGDKPVRKRIKACTVGFLPTAIAAVRTGQGKLCLFVATDRASNFLCDLVKAAPCKVHTVLTDNGQHFTTLGNTASAAPLIREAVDRGELFRAHSFDLARAQLEQ